MDIPNGPIEMPDLDYMQLQAAPPLDEQILATLDANIKNPNWIQTHHCITMVRQLNKFQPNYTNDLLQRYSNAFVELFSLGKTQIIKNLLRMVKEIFDLGQQVNVEKAVYLFLPIILKKSSTDLGHIKEMSQSVLISFAENCGYDISFRMAAQFIIDKNVAIAELSVKLLAKLIEKVGQQIGQLNPETLQEIMRALQVLISGKRQNLHNQSLDICLYIYNLVGSDNYLYLMNFSLKPEEIPVMGSAMESHRSSKAKNSHVPLAQVLRQRKTQMHNFQNENYNTSNFNLGNQ